MTKGSGIFQAASKMDIPVIFFDRVINEPGFSTVTFDDRKGTIDVDLPDFPFCRPVEFIINESIKIKKLV